MPFVPAPLPPLNKKLGSLIQHMATHMAQVAYQGF